MSGWPPEVEEYTEFFEDGYDEEDEMDREHDCGLMENGQCMLAGTEWCDFECHNRDSEMFAGSSAWLAARTGAEQ